MGSQLENWKILSKPKILSGWGLKDLCSLDEHWRINLRGLFCLVIVFGDSFSFPNRLRQALFWIGFIGVGNFFPMIETMADDFSGFSINKTLPGMERCIGTSY
jgi:hypothetical protein